MTQKQILNSKNPNHEWDSCGRKKSFQTPESAVRETEYWWGKEEKILEKYECRYCCCWHLTKSLEH